MARLRDGEMTTHLSPFFDVKAPSIRSETVVNCAVSTIDAVSTVPGISLGGQQNLHAPQQEGDASPGVTSLTEVFGGMWLIRDLRNRFFATIVVTHDQVDCDLHGGILQFSDGLEMGVF